MPKALDLTGQRFGRSVVLAKAISHKGRTAWQMQCNCGASFMATTKALRDGKKASCGCLRKEICANKAENLVGQQFNRLTVTKRIGSQHRKILWEVRCACGNKTQATTGSLKNGSTKSCGCWRQDVSKQRAFDLTGQSFGDVIASKQADNIGKDRAYECECICGTKFIGTSNYLLKGRFDECRHEIGKRYGSLLVVAKAQTINRQRQWECLCDCGNPYVVSTASLHSGNTSSCGCVNRGFESISTWMDGSFRASKASAFFYVFQMANHAEISKPGIAVDLQHRADDQYGELHDFIALPRLEAWLIEQAVLWETRSSHTCPTELSDWAGRTELRKLAPAALFEMACGYHEQLQRLGREEFAIRYLPTTPKQREQLEAMKPQLVAA